MFGDQLGKCVDIRLQTFKNQAWFWWRLYQAGRITRLHLKYAVWTLLKERMCYPVRTNFCAKYINHRPQECVGCTVPKTYEYGRQEEGWVFCEDTTLDALLYN